MPPHATSRQTAAPTSACCADTRTSSRTRASERNIPPVTAGLDGTARVWTAATAGTVASVRPSASPVVDALLVADGRLVTVSDDGVRLYACEPCLRPAQLRVAATGRLESPADRECRVLTTFAGKAACETPHY